MISSKKIDIYLLITLYNGGFMLSNQVNQQPVSSNQADAAERKETGEVAASAAANQATPANIADLQQKLLATEKLIATERAQRLAAEQVLASLRPPELAAGAAAPSAASSSAAAASSASAPSVATPSSELPSPGPVTSTSEKLQTKPFSESHQFLQQEAQRKNLEERFALLVNAYDSAEKDVKSINILGQQSIEHFRRIQSLFIEVQKLAASDPNGIKVAEQTLRYAKKCDERVIDQLLQACLRGRLDMVDYMLANKLVDVNAANEAGMAALHIASQKGDANTVRFLLEKGAKVNKVSKKGVTALHLASLKGKEAVVRILLEAGANPNQSKSCGCTALHDACAEARIGVIRLLVAEGASIEYGSVCVDANPPVLLKKKIGPQRTLALFKQLGCSISAESIQGHTHNRNCDYENPIPHNFNHLHKKLITAIWSRNVESVRKLLAEVYTTPDSINQEREDCCEDCYRCGSTALLRAAALGETEIVKLLLTAGANRGLTNKNNQLPLHMASHEGHLEIVSLLLESSSKAKKNKPKIDAVDGQENTALHLACAGGHIEVARFLLDRGATLGARNTYGSTPLHCACANGHEEVVRLLLERGAKIDVTDADGGTPLFTASRSGHEDTVRLLLEKGANFEQQTLKEQTPLHRACQNGYWRVAQLLLDRGADINKPNHEGSTPLHAACIFDHLKVVRLLLERNAIADFPNDYGLTALHEACQYGHIKSIRLLWAALGNDAIMDIDATVADGCEHFTPRTLLKESIGQQRANQLIAELKQQNSQLASAQSTSSASSALASSAHSSAAAADLSGSLAELQQSLARVSLGETHSSAVAAASPFGDIAELQLSLARANLGDAQSSVVAAVSSFGDIAALQQSLAGMNLGAPQGSSPATVAPGLAELQQSLAKAEELLAIERAERIAAVQALLHSSPA